MARDVDLRATLHGPSDVTEVSEAGWVTVVKVVYPSGVTRTWNMEFLGTEARLLDKPWNETGWNRVFIHPGTGDWYVGYPDGRVERQILTEKDKYNALAWSVRDVYKQYINRLILEEPREV